MMKSDYFYHTNKTVEGSESAMPKPDKVLRFRPLKEVPEAVAKLKRVVLIHPKPIVEELKAKFCIYGKGERNAHDSM